MKQTPQVIIADSLAKSWPKRSIARASSESVDVFWALARPLSMGGLLTRLRLAFKVFTGEYDALKWVQQ
jgi:hypothetical protein